MRQGGAGGEERAGGGPAHGAEEAAVEQRGGDHRQLGDLDDLRDRAGVAEGVEVPGGVDGEEVLARERVGGAEPVVPEAPAELGTELVEGAAVLADVEGVEVIDADALPEDEGWNDIAAGLKYTFYADRESGLLMAAGARYQFESGDGEVLQGNVPELSPFFSIGKAFDRFHVLAAITDRIPLDGGDGNNVLQWDLHLDYDVAPSALPGLAPFVELHGLHYLDDGDRVPLSVGGADYANLGSSDVSGSTVISAGVGARWELSPHASVGIGYHHALTNRNADIFEDRFMIDFILKW